MSSITLGRPRRPLALAVSLAVGSVSGLLAASASSQQAPIEEVMVTGSRIERATGFTSPVPVTAVTADELTEFQPGGTMTEALDALPQFFSTETAQRGSGALFGNAGTSTLNMRGMGAQRTLVLIDGARTVPADRNSRVNTDNIPSALIERVDVVTGGASAAYGADALAGVTNFILNREFEGLDVQLRMGQTSESDGRNWDVSIAGGRAFGQGRLHVIWGLESQKIDQISRDAADGKAGDYFRRYGFVHNPEWYPGAPAGVPQRLVMPYVHSTLHTPGGLINEPGFSFDRHTFLEDGRGTRPFEFGDVGCYRTPGSQCSINSTSGGPEYATANAAFNGGPYGAEVERSNVFFGFQLDVGPRTSVFGHLLAAETQSNQRDRRGNPHLMGVWHGTLFKENPYLPTQIRAAMEAEGFDSIRIDKLGQVRGPGIRNFNDFEEQRNSFETWSVAAGFERDLFDGGNWHLRAQLQRGETDKSTAVLNELRVDRMFLALDAVEVYSDRRDDDGDGVIDVVSEADRGTGEIICNVQRYNPTEAQLAAAVADVRVPAPIGDDSLGGPNDLVPIPGPVGFDNTIRDCVPLNVLGIGHVSPEAQRYLVDGKEGVGAVVQEFAEILLTGEIAEGIGAGPFSMATGATYRAESFWQRSLPRELMAFGPPTNVPELGIRGISAGWAGNRNLHQFSDVPALAGKFDVKEIFAELDFPLLATSRGRTLAANVAWRRSDYSLSGAIDSAKIGLDFGITDSLRFRTTLSRDVREPTFSERFDFQGGGGSIEDPLFNGQQFQTTSVNGGNPALRPEEADTFTAGFVYQPDAAPGLQVSLDHYDIKLTDAVDQLGLQAIVDQCHETGTLCDQVLRDPVTNVVTLVRNVYLNVADARVRGADLDLLWSADVNLLPGRDERLSLRVLAGIQYENSETPAGGRKIDRSGGLNFPEYTAVATLNYRIGDYSIRLQQRYIPETTLNIDWVEGIDVDDNTVASQTWTNLSIGYHRELDNGRAWDASLMVNNLLDTDPPIIPSYGDRGGAQTVNNGYDVFGRRYSLSFSYSF